VKIQKRVEYQKYVRVKLEHKIHRKLFGLTGNIVLVGEEDIVLQREFRIDFVLQKIDVMIRIVGIFEYFREYNLLEFKSINDPLDMVLVDKYIGQLFWWLFAKKRDAKEGIGRYIRNDGVTLTIITVGNPRNVIKELKDYLGEEGFDTIKNGIYQWEVMGVLVRLIAINKLDVIRENYGWLIFAEGEKYKEYRRKLIEEIKGDDSFAVYLELLNELEKEGKERMANEILRRLISDEVLRGIIADMPIEKKEEVFVGLPDSNDVLQRILAGRSDSSDILKSILADMPTEKKEEVLAGLPDSNDVLQRILADMPAEKRRQMLVGIPEYREMEEKLAIIERWEDSEVVQGLLAKMPVEKQRQLLRMLQQMLSGETHSSSESQDDVKD